MNEEKKNNLIFAIFTAENEKKTGNDMAQDIAMRMQTVYGGYWSVFTPYYGSNKFDWTKGSFADFLYEERSWNVYQHDCESAEPTPGAGDLIGVPDIANFDSSTDMEETVKKDLTFAIWASEFTGLDGKAKIDRIHEGMRRIYGGGWSVHENYYIQFYSNNDKNASYSFNLIPGYFAKFGQVISGRDHDYFVFKQQC